MRICGEVTIDDLVDSHRRIWDKSGVLRSRQWYSVIRSCLIAGVGSYLIVPQHRLTTALIAGSVAGFLTVAFRRPSEKDYLQKYLTEQYRGEGPFSFAIELADDCIHVEQAGISMSFLWSAVESMDEPPEGIEFWLKPSGFIFVRNQWFDSPEHRQEFSAIAHSQVQLHARDSTH